MSLALKGSDEPNIEKRLRLHLIKTELLLDYGFPSYPLPFEKYSVSVNWLDQSLLELLTTLHLIHLFNPAGLIQGSTLYKLLGEITSAFRASVAMDDP